MKLTTVAAILVVLGVLGLSRRDAHAIPVIYQSGEDVFVAGDGKFPEPFDKESELDGFQAGYKCDVFGFFWAYLTIKNCKPVAFKGDTYMDEPELASAIKAKHPESSMKVGFWNKHGRILLGLVLVLGVVLVLKDKFGKKGDDDAEPAAG